MKKLKIHILMFCLLIPCWFFGCENKATITLDVPANLSYEDGWIFFDSVNKADYYTLDINGNELIIFPNAEEEKGSIKRIDDKIYYNASKVLNAGENFTIRVRADGKDKVSSVYSESKEYIHTLAISTPENVKINGQYLTWDKVELASAYYVRVVTPLDVVQDYRADTIASLDMVDNVFADNKFNFSSILTTPGDYRFYISAVATNGAYSSSKFTEATIYSHKVTLTTPVVTDPYVLTEFDGLTNRMVENIHMNVIVDESTDKLQIACGDIAQEVALEDTSIVNVVDNVVNVNLTKLFLGRISFKEKNCYVFKVSAKNSLDATYHLTSQYSNEVSIEFYSRIDAPTITSSNDVEQGGVNVSWQISEAQQQNISATRVLVFNQDGTLSSYNLSVDKTSLLITNDYIAICVQFVAKNGYLSSEMSNVVSKYSSPVLAPTFTNNGTTVSWTGDEEEYYIVECGNTSVVTKERSVPISSICTQQGIVKLTVIKDGKRATEFAYNLKQHKAKLTTPIISADQGFVSSTKLYLLTFTPVENAIGYYVYLNGERIPKLFTSENINLYEYITKIGEYRDYTVQIQAVADAQSLFANSDLTDEDALELNHVKVLDFPSVKLYNGAPIERRVVGNEIKYYLHFYGVKDAISYDILINYVKHTELAEANNVGHEYVVDLTSYMPSAGSYSIMISAVANPDAVNIKSSGYGDKVYSYSLKKQLQPVTNIDWAINDSKYTLSFDTQDEASYYNVRIWKVNDATYDEYLGGLNLPNPIRTAGAIEIPNAYLQQAGDYYFFVTAVADESTPNYITSQEVMGERVVNKKNTLSVPTGILYSNVGENSYYISWTGDANADYYIVRLTNPNNVVKEFEVKRTEENIASSITVEGYYEISIKAMVDPKGTNVAYFTNSSYSAPVKIAHSFTKLYDYTRYSFDYNGEKYDYLADSVENLAGILWYHYLFGVKSADNSITNDLPIYVEMKTVGNTTETLRQAIERLSEEAAEHDWFTETTAWINAQNENNVSDMFKELAKQILESYKELALLTDLNCTRENDTSVFRLTYSNALDGVKTNSHLEVAATSAQNGVYSSESVYLPLEYSTPFEYLDKANRRKSNTFAIDTRPSQNVTTTEQLLQVVQYGFKPNFVGDSAVAETVYNNARSVLNAIVNNEMTDLEKTIAIFDWIEHALNLNSLATYTTETDNYSRTTYKLADISVYGKRKEFYLEGVFADLYNQDRDYGVSGYDGEFYLGMKSATAESYAKAFTLLCSIEGITTRKLNDSWSYQVGSSTLVSNNSIKRDGNSIVQNHSWNKVYLDLDGDEEPEGYVVDLAFSDNEVAISTSTEAAHIYTNTYISSSHRFFLVSKDYHINNLSNRGFVVDTDLEEDCNSTYNYYANTKVDTSELWLRTYSVNLLGNSDFYLDFELAKEYLNGTTIEVGNSLYSSQQNFILLWIIKSQEYIIKGNNHVSFEFTTDNETITYTNSIRSIVQKFNDEYKKSGDRIVLTSVESSESGGLYRVIVRLN